jgi:hypothetical protein
MFDSKESAKLEALLMAATIAFLFSTRGLLSMQSKGAITRWPDSAFQMMITVIFCTTCIIAWEDPLVGHSQFEVVGAGACAYIFARVLLYCCTRWYYSRHPLKFDVIELDASVLPSVSAIAMAMGLVGISNSLRTSTGAIVCLSVTTAMWLFTYCIQRRTYAKSE